VKSRGSGPYFQLVRSYREGGKVKQEVLVHLGTHDTPKRALAMWPSEIQHLRAIGRDDQADELEAKLTKLRGLMKRKEQKVTRRTKRAAEGSITRVKAEGPITRIKAEGPIRQQKQGVRKKRKGEK
jgi:hypothetical protein